MRRTGAFFILKSIATQTKNPHTLLVYSQCLMRMMMMRRTMKKKKMMMMMVLDRHCIPGIATDEPPSLCFLTLASSLHCHHQSPEKVLDNRSLLYLEEYCHTSDKYPPLVFCVFSPMMTIMVVRHCHKKTNPFVYSHHNDQTP